MTRTSWNQNRALGEQKNIEIFIWTTKLIKFGQFGPKIQNEWENSHWRWWCSVPLDMHRLEAHLSPTSTPRELIWHTSSWFLVQVGCLRCLRTKCPLFTKKNVFSLSPWVNFPEENVIQWFRKFAGAPNLQKHLDCIGKQKLEGFWRWLCRHMCQTNSAGSD